MVATYNANKIRNYGIENMYHELGQRLKELRLHFGKTQKEVAAAVKIDVIQYLRYEKADRKVPLDILSDLADYYDVSIDYLCGKSDY